MFANLQSHSDFDIQSPFSGTHSPFGRHAPAAGVAGVDGYWWASPAFAYRTCVFCSGLVLLACLKSF